MAFFDGLFGLATVALIAALRGRLAGARSPQRRLHLLRWAIGLPGGLAIFRAHPGMLLADVYAILFALPLFMTALSVPVLGETVGWRRWSAVLVGFVGVLVILRPASGLFGPPALGALFGALVHGCSLLLLRRMHGIDPPEAFGIWGNGLSVIATGSVLRWLWRAPPATDPALHSFAGAIAGDGFFLLVLAHAKAPVAVLAPFRYSQMLYGIALGALLFGDLPDPGTLVGATILVGSGLYIFHREPVRARPGAR